MTRKDYIAFAKIIRAHRERWLDEDCGECPPILAIADDMADLFSNDNPRFDRQRFLQACGTTA